MALIIRHLEGPLKGEMQTFDDSVQEIKIGRSVENDVVIDSNFVSKKHLLLRRNWFGGYDIVLAAGKGLAVDGKPLASDLSNQLKPKSMLRLGGSEGPGFEVEVVRKRTLAGVTGEIVTAIVTRRQEFAVSVTRRLGEASRRDRYIAAAVLALALAFVGVAAYYFYLHSTLEYQIASARAEEQERAKQHFAQAVTDKLLNAVYLVVKDDAGVPKAAATAWAFAPTELATNAHVTEAIDSARPGTFYLLGPSGERIEIEGVTSHSGYKAFKAVKATKGTARGTAFTPLDLTSAYDVGTINIDPATPLPVDPATGKPVTLELASNEDLQKLALGLPVASAGFPSEDLVGAAALAEAPIATLQFGHISSLKDVFMSRADDPTQRLLIQHSVPVAGGVSGSPLIDATGKVIAIVSGGNVILLGDENAIGGRTRAPSGALVNFAQRVDLLRALDSGDVDPELVSERAYWDEAGKRFDNFFDVALAAFLRDAGDRYVVADGQEKMFQEDQLGPKEGAQTFTWVRKTYEYPAEPDWLYGFIADSKSGVPIGLNVKHNGEIVRQAKDPNQSYEPELAPVAWATVTKDTTLEIEIWGMIDQSARFVLHAYRWNLLTESPGPSAANRPADETQ